MIKTTTNSVFVLLVFFLALIQVGVYFSKEKLCSRAGFACQMPFLSPHQQCNSMEKKYILSMQLYIRTVLLGYKRLAAINAMCYCQLLAILLYICIKLFLWLFMIVVK